MQLALIHGQLTSLLTASAINSIFLKNPGYDARRLLGGSDVMLESLINSFTSSPAALLGAFPSFPIEPLLRTTISENLKLAIETSNSIFGLIISANCVVALESLSSKQRMQQWDVLLLLNFLKSNTSLRQAETVFTPICLPTYNPNGHLHAYIQFLDTQTDTAVVLLAGGANPDFEKLSAAQQQLKRTMLGGGGGHNGGMLAAIKNASRELNFSQCQYTSLETLREALLRAGIGLGCLLHCVYKRSVAQQFVATPWASVAADDENLKRVSQLFFYTHFCLSCLPSQYLAAYLFYV
jgi:Second Longin domain of FUZ, MON1 and HPS1